MAQYEVDLHELGKVVVDASDRGEAIREARRIKGLRTNKTFLYATASVRRIGAKTGRPSNFPW